MKLLISGGIGLGKTTASPTARDTLRSAGLTVLTRPPRAGDPPDAALVIDDAHLLSEPELLGLTERVADPALDSCGGRRTPGAAAGHSPWPSNGIDLAFRWVRCRSPITCWPSTAGLPFLVRAVTDGTKSPAQAAKFALIERLRRLDEPTLDTLLIMSLTQELGQPMWLRHCGISATQAHQLVDRARASGLTRAVAQTRSSCSSCTARSRRSSAMPTTTRSKPRCCVHNSTCRPFRRISRCDSPNTGCATTGWPASSPGKPQAPGATPLGPRGFIGPRSTPAPRA